MCDTCVPSLIVVGIAINQLEITLGWPCYLGIPGYLNKGVSWDNPGMATLLGNPGILGQGGVYGCPSWDNPRIVVLCI